MENLQMWIIEYGYYSEGTWYWVGGAKVIPRSEYGIGLSGNSLENLRPRLFHSRTVV